MNIQLQQPDSNIPLEIYQLASKHNLGTPLKRHRRRLLEITYPILLLLGVLVLGWLVYQIYGYVAFIVLSHTYPDASVVPADQLDNYFWLQALHDNFWKGLLGPLSGLFSLITIYARFLTLRQTKFYICTEGLLKTFKSSDEGVRWDEVKELIINKGVVNKLIKQDNSSFDIPIEQISDFGAGKKFNNLIKNEVTRCLLPEKLASYERGEIVTFGSLEIGPKGILRPWGRIYWEQIGDVTLKRNTIAIYYNKAVGAKQAKGQLSPALDDKWQTWRKDIIGITSWPNMPVFVAMVKAILAQQQAGQFQTTHIPQQSHTIPGAVVYMKRREKRRRITAIALIATTILVIISLFAGLIIHANDQEQDLQARAARATKTLQNHFTQLAHQQYKVHTPGENCGNGKNFWLDDDSKNIYTCENDGLLMTQKDMQYEDGEYFTFVPDDLLKLDSASEDFSSINYYPHNYRVQVQANILTHEPGACVTVEVHIQDFQGGQWFDICSDGSWYYSRCTSDCSKSQLIASGGLMHPSYKYLLRVDVTDNTLTLFVNNIKVTTINDATYNTTNQLEFGVYGSNDTKGPVTALFSDFAYTPSL